MLQYQREQKAIEDAIATFPTVFGLRGYPGKKFIFSVINSYMSDGVIMLYTRVMRPDGTSADFVKGTVEEFNKEVVATPEQWEKVKK